MSQLVLVYFVILLYMQSLVTENMGWRGTPAEIIALLEASEGPLFRAYIADLKGRLLERSGIENYRPLAPEYFSEVRSALRRYVENWLDSGASWVMRSHDLDDFCRQSEAEIWMPAVRPAVRRAPAKIVLRPPIENPEMEAARLFVSLLTSEELYKVKRCPNCKRIFFGRSNRKCCSDECSAENLAGSQNFKRRRVRYMQKLRKADAREVVKWAAESKLEGEELAQWLNQRLGKRRLVTIQAVSKNWVTRHWSEIQKQRGEVHAKTKKKAVRQRRAY